MSEKIVEGKRRKFLSEKPNSDDPMLETQFSESIEDILEQEFKKIKDIPGVDTIKLFWGHRPRGKISYIFSFVSASFYWLCDNDIVSLNWQKHQSLATL